jgi:hypothetical protein
MEFDLYPAPPQSMQVKPAATTLDALEAAEWTCICEGVWELTWADHTAYADACHEDEGAKWMCQLSRQDGRWIYDFDHDHRGGPQVGNGIDVDDDASIEEAQAACKNGLEHWIQRWTDAAEEDRQQAEKDAEDKEE